MKERGQKGYVLSVTILEGNDEFWEDIGKRSGRKEVLAEVRSCLAAHGFCPPDCKVVMDDTFVRYTR